MSWRTTVPVLLGLASALPGASAQQPPPPPTPIFGETVEVRVVNLEVVVSDRDGLPVTGLRAGDFRLLVDGAETPIRYFTEVRGGAAVASPTPGTPSEPGVAGVPDLVAGEPVGTSYLVFIDDYFSIARDRDLVLSGIADQLSRLGPEDRMAIVAYDGTSVDMLSTWSTSSAELTRALRQAAQRPAQGLRRLAERRNFLAGQRLMRPGGFGAVGSPLDNRLGPDERYYADVVEQQVRNEVSAAVGALRGFANPPGRKVMLLLSGGWPYDIASYVSQQLGRPVLEPAIAHGADLLAPLIDTANQLGYTLFPVDVPGLTTDSGVDAADAAPPVSGEQFAAFVRENNAQYSLQYLARETGGQALLNASRRTALERAANATRTYYWLGFVPQWQGDDRAHRVRVEVRREGLKVRSRAGYVDISRQRETSMAVESILMFGNGANARPLDLRVGAARKASSSTMRVSIELAVPADQLTLVPIGGQRIADFELRVAAIDDRGQRSEMPVLPVRLAVDAEPRPGQRAVYQTELELRRTHNRVVVALYDPVAGVIWSATTDIRP
jgi:VWFA-related protein